MNYQDKNLFPDLTGVSNTSKYSLDVGDKNLQTPFLVESSRETTGETWLSEIANADARRGTSDGLHDRPPYRVNHSDYDHATQGNLESLLRLVGAIRRQFWLIALLSFFIFLATLGIILTLQPRYTATTLLVVDPRDTRSPASDTGGAVPSINVDSEVEMMNSAKVAQQVVQRLDLTQDPRFLKAPSLGASSTGGLFAFLERLSLAMSGGGQSLAEVPILENSNDAEGKSPTEADGLREGSANSANATMIAADALQKITNVRRRGLTNVIALDVTINNPKDAARLANAYADIYIDEQVNAKLRAAGHTEAALSKRVSELGEALRRSEAQIKAFTILQTSQSNNETMRREIDRLQADVMGAAQEADSKAARLREVDRFLASGDYLSVAKALGVPEIRLLDEQRRSLEQRIQLPSEEGTNISNLRQRLGAVNSQLQAIGGQRVEALRHQAEASRDHLALLRKELEETIEKTDLSTDLSVGLFQLQQEVTTTRQLYLDYLGRLKSMTQQRNLMSPNVYVVAEAGVPPSRSFPPRFMLLVLGSAAGLGIAVGVGYLRDNYPRNIKFVGELEVASGIPTIGVIPIAKRTKSHYLPDEICKNPLSEYSEAIRRLRITLGLTANGGSGCKSVLVTSPGRQEGRSTVALSLARDAARAGLKVVLMDCDLRNPSLHTGLGLSQGDGVVQLLSMPGSVPVSSVIKKDPQSACSVITVGEFDRNELALTSQPQRLGDIIKECESNYDLVVVDSSPTKAAADVLIMAQNVDSIILIARSTRTQPNDIRIAVQEVSRSKDDNVFPVLNFATAPIIL